MITRGFALVALTALPLACSGCGNSTSIKVSGKLLKGGQPYVPPAGQRVVVTLFDVDESKDASGKPLPPRGPFQSYFDPKDGTFVVPGPDGQGVPPGKYRVSIFQGLTREGESKALAEHKGPTRNAPRIDRETDMLKGAFGPSISPIVREVSRGTELIVDLDKEMPAPGPAQTERRKREGNQ